MVNIHDWRHACCCCIMLKGLLSTYRIAGTTTRGVCANDFFEHYDRLFYVCLVCVTYSMYLLIVQIN